MLLNNNNNNNNNKTWSLKKKERERQLCNNKARSDDLSFLADNNYGICCFPSPNFLFIYLVHID